MYMPDAGDLEHPDRKNSIKSGDKVVDVHYIRPVFPDQGAKKTGE
jgi:hypothetical protein